jgi:LytR cell envelope-related transcriptional attenuator
MSFARVRALVVIGVLTVAAVVFVVTALLRDTQGGPVKGNTCPDGFVRANVELPEPKQVKVKVYNATSNDGWGTQITEDFKNRRFITEKPADNKKVLDDVAILRFGPKTVGAAHLLRAYFLDQATPEYNPRRTNDIVDVVIGTGFKQLATTTEVNQSLVELGEPEVPAGACPANAA